MNARLADHNPQRRTCLRCEKEFWSGGPGNRVCGRCKGREKDHGRLSKRQTEVFADVRRGK